VSGSPTVARHPDRVVPPSGPTAWLTTATSGAMAFLAVFALALALASGRLADRWSEGLASSATIRISAPPDQMAAQTQAVLDLLGTTPGIASARALDPAEERALLEPWFGPDLPLEQLPIPKLIEVVEDGSGYDAEGLRLRLSAEAPGAVLILGTMGAMITLAANAALATNAQVIRVLRLVGARDAYIARAFVRRFTLRAFGGAAGGTLLGMAAVAALPDADAAGGFLTGLGFQGAGWLLPLALPPLAGIVAFVATRVAAFTKLRDLT
jgi:cell division transport system permease protein